MENIVVLGSTGSIGSNTLDILRKSHKYKLLGLSFNKNIDLAMEQIKEFKPSYVCCADSCYADIIKEKFSNITVLMSQDGLCEMASLDGADYVVNALVGTSGLLPTYFAIKSQKKFALANKESLVIAGRLFYEMAKKNSVEIIPIDSEHSAIYQCLENREKDDVSSIILTASGGPFLNRKNFDNISVEDALNHPNWSMGKKITIDSATLMNKGFEIMEARWLFDMTYDKINVLVHKESVVHSAVEFIDGSILAQLGVADMRIPINYALFKPRRLKLNFKLDLSTIGKLTFEKPDFDMFPTLNFAYDALKKEDKNLGLLLNAADEIAVNYFVAHKIKFKSIFDILKYAVYNFEDNLSDDIYEIAEETAMVEREIKNLIEKDFLEA